MENTLNVAKCLYETYLELFKHPMDEMKMHKLMYFVQRESLMFNKKELFDEPFLGWKYGPVLASVRGEYLKGTMFSTVSGTVSEETKRLVNSVLKRYGTVSSWKLSSLSHNEFSWKCARKGLASFENGNVKLTVNAMKGDAARELAERKSNFVETR